MARILIISSTVHEEMAALQLDHCLRLVEKSSHEYEVERLEAGTYEIPFLINVYNQQQAFDAYIALGLLIQANKDHYDFIMSHIKHCFTHFALNKVIVGNGIISGASKEDLAFKVNSQDPCLSAYPSAFRAVDCLIKFKQSTIL